MTSLSSTSDQKGRRRWQTSSGFVCSLSWLLLLVCATSCCHAFAERPWNNGPSRSRSLQASSGSDDIKTADLLSLESIRSTLIRQEETIIFALIERAQFRLNPSCYEPGALGPLGAPPGTTESTSDSESSFLEYMLLGTEALHSQVRRYTSPEEHAFFPDRLPSNNLVLKELEYPSDLLDPCASHPDMNFNPILLQKYIKEILPSICQAGDDEQYGSAVLCDIAILQALSRRVHYGKFVAESKYLSDPEAYQQLVADNNHQGVMELLTNAKVEEQVLRRARLKAATYGTEPLSVPSIGTDSSGDTTTIVAAAAASAVVAALEAMKSNDATSSNSNNIQGKVNPETVEQIYEKYIIPLTKDIEVAYLFRRCGKEPPSAFAPTHMSNDYLAGKS